MIQTNGKRHIYYIGDWVFHKGPVFSESPFHHEFKDCDLYFYGKRLAEALAPAAELTCHANWQLYHLEPGNYEKLLHQSDAVIVSDVEAKCFHLYPQFFDRTQHSDRWLTLPDRLVQLKQWVFDGGGLIMLGGWLSFSGAKEEGGWRRSAFADALPVQCLIGEDLVESSAGFHAELVRPDHPLAVDLPWHSFPPIFGYNELMAKSEEDVIVRVRETGHPLVIAGKYGNGRIMIYASDPAPHWGINFERWPGYDMFWRQAYAWVAPQK